MGTITQVRFTLTESQSKRFQDLRKKRKVPDTTSDDSFVRAILVSILDVEVPSE